MVIAGFKATDVYFKDINTYYKLLRAAMSLTRPLVLKTLYLSQSSFNSY